jgi:hypothetical protein
VAVGQPVVENAWHGGDQSIVITLAGGSVGELDGSRQRSFDLEGIRPEESGVCPQMTQISADQE